MNSKLFTLFFICLGNLLHAQVTSTITARAIYDFEVGDEFHYVGTENNYGPGYYNRIRKKVLAKAYNADSTQVTYTIERARHQNDCERDLDTIQEQYHQLNALFDPAYINGLPFYTSAIYPYCGQLPFEYAVILSIDTAFVQRPRIQVMHNYHDWENKHWAVGLGEVYIRLLDGSACCSINLSLVYYKKGNEEWGTPDSFLVTGQLNPPAVMTRRTIFDFEVGDMFQRHIKNNSFGTGVSGGICTESYRQYCVSCKYWNSSESVSYTFQVVDSSLLSNEVTRYTEQVTYDNLSAPCFEDPCRVRNYAWRDACPDSKWVNYKWMSGSSYYSYFEEKLHFIEGCGKNEESSHSSYGSGGSRLDTLVWYYKIAENKSCGERMLLISDTKSTEEAPNIRVSYDLSVQRLLLYLPSSLERPRLTIADMSGRIVYQDYLPSQVSQVLVEGLLLEKGVYVALLEANDGYKTTFKLVAGF